MAENNTDPAPTQTPEPPGSPDVPDRSYFYFILLPSPDRSHALVEVLPSGSRQLPILKTSDYYHDITLMDLEEEMAHALRVKIRFVRELWCADRYVYTCLWGNKYDEVSVLLVEWDEAEKSVESLETTKWVPRSELERTNWVETDKELQLDMGKIVSYAMNEINGEVDLKMAPWRRTGGFTKMMAWVQRVLNCNIPHQQFYQEFRKCADHHHSAVWRLNLNNADDSACTESDSADLIFFVKAALPPFAEAQRTAAIARVLHDIVPDVIAVHERDCILLMREASEIEVDDVDPRMWIDTILKIHLSSVDHIEELKASGVEVRDSEWLCMNIHRLLFHEGLERMAQGNDQCMSKLREMQGRECEVIDACKRISRFKIPHTLVHGDVNRFNFGSPKTPESTVYQFFDWDLSYIGHPFADVGSIQLVVADETSVHKWMYEYWKAWRRKISEEDFSFLRVLADLVNDWAAMDMYLKEFEHYGYSHGLKYRLVEYVDVVKHTLDNIKNWIEEDER